MRLFTFFEKIKTFLKQGATPKALAISTTVGLLLGLFPVLGVTTLMMSAISVRWRLNLPLMLAISYVIYPFQILLLIPFVRVGEWLTGAQPAGLSLAALDVAFKKDFMAAMGNLGVANLQALFGWCLIVLPLGAVVYWGMFLVFNLVLQRRKTRSEEMPLS